MKDLEAFCGDPGKYYGHSLTRMQTQKQEDVDALRLEGLKHRFYQLRNKVPMLKKLADNEGIEAIERVNDVVPLLFDHTTYKSYPPSLLHNNRFDQLTKWLNKLTAHDLSCFDASNCDNVDDWLLEVCRRTPLKPCHTSGTSGTFSFMPKTHDDWRRMVKYFQVAAFQTFGVESEPEEFPLSLHAIFPFFRSGGNGHMTLNDAVVELICGGDESRFHAAYPERLSSEIMLLAARIRSAESKGTLDKLDLTPELLARKDAFLKQQQEMPENASRLFATMGKELAGERVFMVAPSAMLFQMATTGLEQGDRGLFAPDSVIISGGGGKGIVLPDDWDKTVSEYLGARVIKLYGMTELFGFFECCEHGHYHLMPNVVPYILDPETSKPYPREGVVTGRWAHFDLMADSFWGGFVSGDEVTMHWDADCPCGRTSQYLEGKIERYSDKVTGEDKITCGATADTYKEAMDFLTNVES